jgi:hypothetical protein
MSNSNHVFSVPFELELDLLSEECEQDQALVKALAEVLGGVSQIENLAKNGRLELSCDAWVEPLIDAILSADPGSSSPAEGGFAQIESIEIVRDGQSNLDFDGPVPEWLAEEIETRCLEFAQGEL